MNYVCSGAPPTTRVVGTAGTPLRPRYHVQQTASCQHCSTVHRVSLVQCLDAERHHGRRPGAAWLHVVVIVVWNGRRRWNVACRRPTAAATASVRWTTSDRAHPELPRRPHLRPDGPAAATRCSVHRTRNQRLRLPLLQHLSTRRTSWGMSYWHCTAFAHYKQMVVVR